MASVFDLRRKELMMSDAEASDLIARGFAPGMVDFLRERGFRESGDIRHDDGSVSHTFLRQSHFPHLHVELNPNDSIDDLLTSIYERGWTDGSSRVATFFNRLAEECRRPRPPTASERSIDQRLSALELKLNTSLASAQ